MDADPPEPDVAAPARTAVLDARPSRSTSILVGASVVVGLAFVVWRGPRHARHEAPIVEVPVAGRVGEGEQRLEQAMSGLQSAPMPSQNPEIAKILEALDDVAPSSAGRKLADGSDPPALPSGAPRRVRFGVTLVRYRGAQLAPADAPARDVALERAQALSRLAKDDFPAAVRAGDVGSNVDIGAVKRGVLEPATEYVLFTLPVGWTSEVLDTPRGFWIVKRLR